MSCKIHPLSDVQSSNIGSNTSVWQYCVILPQCKIGSNCNICSHVLIENDVVIGDNVTIKSGVQIWDGVTIEDNVFVGPNVTFTNDIVPRSKGAFDKKTTLLKKGCSVGANSTIVAGHIIGEYAFVGAGSVVTKNIAPNTVWYGNPAQQKGFITNEGILLDMAMKDENGVQYKIESI